MLRVSVSRSYTVIFWLLYLIPSLLLLPFPFILWYKMRVVDRNYIEVGEKTLHLYQGHWFLLDDDVLYQNAVDHIKIDRTIVGHLLGWCTIVITSRSSSFTYSYVDLAAAEELRRHVIA